MNKAVEIIFGSDKNLVIFAVVAITIYAMYMLGAAGKEIAGNALSGLFGIAVGQKLSSTSEVIKL